MPTAARRSTNDTNTSETVDVTTTTAEEAATSVKAAAGEAAGKTSAAGAGALHSLGQVITMPVTVTREVVDDVVTTVRRPDAMLYLGGLIGLAALGVLEWPVAAAAGVGLAIANGARRARA